VPLPRIGATSGGEALPNAGPTPSPYPLLNLIFDYPDNVDGTHPLNLDYFMPANLKQVVTARLSFRLRAFRSYETGVASSSSGASSAASAGGTWHSHEFGAPLGIINANVGFDVNGNLVSNPAAGGGVEVTSEFVLSAVKNNSSPVGPEVIDAHTHLIPHTHVITPTLTYGVFEGAVATGAMITFDGVPGTGLLVGPFNTDQIELDVTSQISTLVDGLWHTIAIQPTGLGRITAMLRLEYFSAVVQH